MKQHAPLNILLVDDDTDDSSFFEKALKKIPIATHLSTVNDGEELMNYLSENSDTLPDVIFLDLNMPRKNGFECLAEIKENEKLKDIFVVMFSISFPQDKEYELYMIKKLLKMGAHYHIIKTHDFEQLQKSVHDA